MNLANQAAQHTARTHFNICGHAIGRKALHGRFPKHRAMRSAAQALRLPTRRRACGEASTLATTGTRGSRTRRLRSSGARRSSAGFISAQWNGALTGSGHDAPGAQLFCTRACAVNRRAVSRNDDLTPTVQVRRRHNLALRRLFARLCNLVGVQARGSPPWHRCQRAQLPAYNGLDGAPVRTASANEKVPAATWAEYSPRL